MKSGFALSIDCWVAALRSLSYFESAEKKGTTAALLRFERLRPELQLSSGPRGAEVEASAALGNPILPDMRAGVRQSAVSKFELFISHTVLVVRVERDGGLRAKRSHDGARPGEVPNKLTCLSI